MVETMKSRFIWMTAIAAAAFLIGARAAGAAALSSPDGPENEVATAEYRWEQSPHGALLERILPPTVEPRQLPEPRSQGARLTAAYCVQCHYLPNPAMHNAAKWKPVVARMVWRMEGKGNLGALMQEMMADVKAPSAAEQTTLIRYLQKYAQKEIDAQKYSDLKSPPGQMFSIACSQCHVLPDPRRHTALEWPRVVERMQRNMAWANRVTGDSALCTSPELNTEEIIRFLQRHSRTH
jgi:mono/diheme cytochrome c family protein